MEKEYVQSVYNVLYQNWKEYCSANDRKRNQIEDSVRRFADNMNDELYLLLNSNSASGLFRTPFFQRDLEHSLDILNRLLGE